MPPTERNRDSRRRGAARIFLALAVAGLAVLFVILVQPAPPLRQDADRPNVVLITFCTLRADRIGCYGYERADTPNLDALADGGVVFDNHYTQASFSGGSFASILTGKYCFDHGIWDHPQPLAEENRTLAEILNDREYRTAAFVTHPFVLPKHQFNQGFETYRHRDKPLRQARAAASWIAEHDDRPFFLWFQAHPCHHPYRGPKDLLPTGALPLDPAINRHGKVHGKTRKSLGRLMFEFEALGYTRKQIESALAMYDATVAVCDRCTGRILDQLEQSGLTDNTLVIVTSDHGEAHGEKGVWFNHANNLQESVVRVPLILRSPAISDTGLNRIDRISSVTRNIDLLPTVLDTLNLAGPDGIDGSSLLPVLKGVDTGRDAFAESGVHRPERAGLMHYRQYVDGIPGKQRMLRRGDFKLVHIPGDGQQVSDTYELYDLSVDPNEQHNIAAERPKMLESMKADLSRWFAHYDEVSTQAQPLDSQDFENLRSLGYVD